MLTQEEIDWLNAYNANVAMMLAPMLPLDQAVWLKEKCRAI